ncbi:MAG: hypothetical protein ABJN42_07430 [Roseibium sp.]|uniref:hypothetical protein n=1 Tax=Roseibium sp. TaxID=1936156 RepID=UPI0032978156
MISLEVRKHLGKFSLTERSFDMGGVDRTHLVSLTMPQAYAITGDHTNLRMNASDERSGLGFEKKDLHVCRVPMESREPNTRAWYLQTGGETIGFVTDDTVRLLQEHAIVHFEPDQPNWETREIEVMDDEIHNLQEKIENVEERRAAALAKMADDSPSL